MEQCRVLFGFPGLPKSSGTLAAWRYPSRVHRVRPVQDEWTFINFDSLWAAALNALEAGEATHFAMLHSDVDPGLFWIDPLLEVMDRRRVGLVSATVAVKDERRLLSCGIWDPKDAWMPLRRLTVKELLDLPNDFDAEDLGYPGYPLLHNSGCWVADLRLPQWRETDAAGELIAHFHFARRVHRSPDTGKWEAQVISEDCYFSQRVHELGIPSAICKMATQHRGPRDWPSNVAGDEGQDHDEGTRHKWGREVVEAAIAAVAWR